MSGRPGVSDARHPAAERVWFGRVLAENIKRIREEEGVTQRGLAKACGCSESTVSKWEEGTTSVPAYALWRIEQALGCNLYDLMPVGAESDEEDAA